MALTSASFNYGVGSSPTLIIFFLADVDQSSFFFLSKVEQVSLSETVCLLKSETCLMIIPPKIVTPASRYLSSTLCQIWIVPMMVVLASTASSIYAEGIWGITILFRDHRSNQRGVMTNEQYIDETARKDRIVEPPRVFTENDYSI